MSNRSIAGFIVLVILAVGLSFTTEVSNVFTLMDSSPPSSPLTVPNSSLPGTGQFQVVLALVPEETYLAIDDTITVPIFVQTGGFPAQRVSAHLNFDANFLEVVHLSPSADFPMDTILQQQFSNVEGTVDFTAVSSAETAPIEPFALVEVTLKAIASVSETSITFTRETDRYSDIGYEEVSYLDRFQNMMAAIGIFEVDVGLENGQLTTEWSLSAALCGYQVYRSLDPYFTPGPSTFVTEFFTDDSFADSSGIGALDLNYSYIIRAIACHTGSPIDSKEFGDFDFEIVPGNA
ncbi:MAG: hypothetical protein AAF614_15400 [Chloroflexota bacterium]